MNDDNNNRYVDAKFIAKRWSMDVSTVRRKLAKISIRMGTRKGSGVRYDFQEILNLETNWKERL